MTVLIRDEANEADLAWAAADPAIAGAVGELLRARQAVAGTEGATRPRGRGESGPLLPSFLRERGAL